MEDKKKNTGKRVYYVGEPEMRLLEKVAGLIGKVGSVATYCDCSTCACGSCACNCSCNACGACYCDCSCSPQSIFSLINLVDVMRTDVGQLQEIISSIKAGGLHE